MTGSQKKKILIVAESIDIEDSSGSKANVALIQNLADAGFEVFVYHYTRKEINLPGIPCSEIKERKWNRFYLLSRFQRKLQHAFDINLARYVEPKFGFSFTFLNDSRSISEALENSKIHPDLVLTLSKGASFRPHHALLALPKFHDIWIAYVHDPYPFHFYPEPYNWSEPGFPQKINFFNNVSQKCKWAAFPSLLLQKWMEEKYPAFRNKGLVIPHQLTSLAPASAKLPSYFESSKFNIVHAGSLLKERNPSGLLRGYWKFLERNKEAVRDSQLLFLGGVAAEFVEELNEYSRHLNSFHFNQGYLPFDKVKLMQESASVNVILEAVASQSPFLPGKFPHCIAANKIILYLGPEKNEVIRLLGKDYPYAARANDPERIASILEEIYNLWKQNKEEVLLNRKDMEDYLSVSYLRGKIGIL